jgi:CRISPR-associated exonuclease Cas4
MQCWSDEEKIMISAVQHFSYCPRQCALIHMEQVFEENIFTIKGQIAHERVDEATTRTEKGVRVERALPLWSDKLGLIGKADVVEFHDNIPYPVEYKLGRQKKTSWHSDLQLCTQALCLEEMLEVEVPKGAIYHCTSHKRREVVFTESMKNQVISIILEIRKMLASETLPPPLNDWQCKDCSLKQACLPESAEISSKEKQAFKDLFVT